MSHIKKDLYKFGEFSLDVSERLLIGADGEKIALPEKVFATLCFLVSRAGLLVRKDELLETVWDGAFVEENILDKTVYTLRRALGEKRGEKIYIETVRKHGYRFVAEVARVEIEQDLSPKAAPIKTTPSAAPRISENHHYAVERHGNVLTLADWQSEREVVAESPPSVAAENSPAQTEIALPVAQVEIRRGWSPNRVAVLLFILTLLGGGLVFSFNHFPDLQWTNPTNSFERVNFRKVVGSDGGYSPTISPDGKTAAYRDANSIIWIENLTTGSRVQLKNSDEPVKGSGLKFAPDGNYLYFSLQAEGETQISIFRVAVPNGTPRKIVANTLTDAAVSPDGGQIAFVRQEGSADIWEYAILVINSDGTNERKIASHFSPNWFGLWGSYLAWSPDGTKIAALGGVPDYKVGDPASIIVVNVADGAEFIVPNPDWQTRELGELTWAADGNALLITAKDSTNAPSQIWQVSYPQGAWRRITNDLNDYSRVDVSADGKTVITTQTKTDSHLWQMPFADTTRARQLTDKQSYRDGNLGLALAPDGNQIVYASSESGNYEIWSTNADGEHRRQLTFGSESATEPIVPPDNRYIFLINTTNGIPNLWRINLDGGNLTQLTHGDKGAIDRPAVTPDSRFVIYTAYTVPPKTGLFRIPLDGGEPVELTDKFGGYMPVISPDGKWIAYNFYDYETSELPWRTGIMPITGGAPVKNIEQPLRGQVRWTTDSQSLLHLDKKWMNLRQTPVFSSGAPKQITDFKTGYLRRFALSQDGKQLVLARGVTETGIVVIQDEP